MANTAALDDDHKAANTPTVTTAIFSPLNIGYHEGVADVRAWDDVSVGNGEPSIKSERSALVRRYGEDKGDSPAMRLAMAPGGKFEKETALSDVGWKPF